MSLFKKIFFAVLALQVGCGSTSPKTMQTAVITEPSVATSNALNAAVSRALNGTKVSLARDAFTKSSELQIERLSQDSAARPGLNGRMMGVPEVYKFSLKSSGGSCYLLHQKTGKTYLVDGVNCRVL